MRSDKTEQNNFFPYFLFEITLVAMFTIEAALILAVLFPPPIGREIDFSAQYSPRPEWYFLFLYQLTKYFSGAWTFVGAVLLPGLAFSALLFTPFLDRSRSTGLGQRKILAFAGFGLLSAVIVLTLLSLL
jgi:quinol-cytochrome oxidoreductase complex cytochrome b subunit